MQMDISLAHAYRAHLKDQEMPQEWLQFAKEVFLAARKVREAQGFRTTYFRLEDTGPLVPWIPSETPQSE